jgi:hypothetical protein
MMHVENQAVDIIRGTSCYGLLHVNGYKLGIANKTDEDERSTCANENHQTSRKTCFKPISSDLITPMIVNFVATEGIIDG